MNDMNDTPLSLTFAAAFAEPATVDAPRRFSGVAYSGGLVPGYWQGDIAIDLAGITMPAGDIPILSSHVNDLSAICGKGRVRLENDAILIDGELASNRAGLEVAGLATAGVPLQLSVGLYQTSVEEFGGKTRKVECNGQLMDLHAVIRSGTLREVSFVALGADPNTSVQIFKPAAHAPGAGDRAAGEEKGDIMELEALNARVAELEAENTELKAAAEAARAAAREVEIKDLFAAVGRDYTEADATLADVWGKFVVVAYTEIGGIAEMGRPTYGYTYRLGGYPVVEQAYQDRSAKSWVYPVTDEEAAVMADLVEQVSLTSKAKGLSGMAENIRQGYRAGGSAPRGYRLETVATGAVREGQPVTKTRLVTADDAMLVRAYLQQRARGVPRARALKAVGVDWPVASLIYMERGALTYAGHSVWNRHAERGQGTKFRPRDEWVIERDTHESLISEAEADTILAELESRKRTRARDGAPGLLRGLLETPDGQRWHADGEGNYRLGKGKRIKAESVDTAVLDAMRSDLAGDEFARAVLDHYKALSKPAGRDRAAAKAMARIREIDQQTHRLAELMAQTTAPDALLRSIEKLEAERAGLAEQVQVDKEAESMQKAMRSLTLAQVKTFLGNIKMEDMGADAMAALVERVTLDPATIEARIYYKIANLTGDKVASPRGFEPRLSP